jgi:hypothetical protein
MRPWSKINKLKNFLDGARNSHTAVTIVEHDDMNAKVQPMNLQKSGTLSAMAVGIQVLHSLGEPREDLKTAVHQSTRRAG